MQILRVYGISLLLFLIILLNRNNHISGKKAADLQGQMYTYHRKNHLKQNEILYFIDKSNILNSSILTAKVSLQTEDKSAIYEKKLTNNDHKYQKICHNKFVGTFHEKVEQSAINSPTYGYLYFCDTYSNFRLQITYTIKGQSNPLTRHYLYSCQKHALVIIRGDLASSMPNIKYEMFGKRTRIAFYQIGWSKPPNYSGTSGMRLDRMKESNPPKSDSELGRDSKHDVDIKDYCKILEKMFGVKINVDVKNSSCTILYKRIVSQMFFKQMQIHDGNANKTRVIYEDVLSSKSTILLIITELIIVIVYTVILLCWYFKKIADPTRFGSTFQLEFADGEDGIQTIKLRSLTDISKVGKDGLGVDNRVDMKLQENRSVAALSRKASILIKK
ncbi:hypothetical protein SNEBB_004989 [Seison nebaliae]|nr:hypothetical protein SNEBB_004989 [Seison nebaliae]